VSPGTDAPTLPVADPWFRAEDAGDRITRITEPHVDVAFRANAWFVRGRDRDLLIDTGNGVGSLPPVVAELQEDPGRDVVAVATHHHLDHAGGLREFSIRAAHRLDVPAISLGDDSPALVSSAFDADFRAAIEVDGYRLPPVLVDAVPYDGFDVEGFTFEGTESIRVLEEGSVIDLGDRHLEVLHLPGHTPGSIGLWESAAGILFSGDAVYRDDVLLDELPDSSIPDYLASIERLRGLPVRVVHGGHDPSFGRGRLLERCDEYAARRADG
jgi:glyoxylase-like metal-dependent hydrolase (beta-lactamase superfamily II)